MDVLTSETCIALNNEILKQVTSSWSLFIQLYQWLSYDFQKQHLLVFLMEMQSAGWGKGFKFLARSLCRKSAYCILHVELSFRPSVWMYQRCSHWKDLRGIWCWEFLWKSAEIFIGAGAINSPLKNFFVVKYHQAVRLAVDVYILGERARTLCYKHIA